MAGRYEQLSIFDLLQVETPGAEDPREGYFSRDEIKVLSEGFNLVRYCRFDKTIEMSEADPCNGWLLLDPFPTYAAAERKLKEKKDRGDIETGTDGKIIMTGWNQPNGLSKAGFEFYRRYDINQYTPTGSIKQGSKNWSNWGKYDNQEELQAAWDTLMETDMKALRG